MFFSKINRELELLKRHIRILRLLDKKGPIGILKLSYITKIPVSQVRYSLRVLQQSGFLQPTTKGAKINQKAITFIKSLELEKKKLAKETGKI